MALFDEETAKQLLAQVEFYFSDSNLPRDSFLQKTVTHSKDGLVSLPLLCSFSRMRNLLRLGKIRREDIPERVLEGVADILRRSDFLKVSDNGKRVGRGTKLSAPEEVLEQVDRRTIAASPFEYSIKMEAVGSFFSQYGKVNSVRLPHHIQDKRYFCGTALVEFSSDQDTEEILKQSLVYGGADLVLTPKKDFDSQRAKMIKELDNTGSILTDTSHNEFQRGQLLKFTLKRIESGEKVANNGTPKNLEKNIKGKEDKVKAGTCERVEENDRTKESEYLVADISCATLFKESGDEVNANQLVVSPGNNSDSVCSEVLKDTFQRFGTVKFIDYSAGSDWGYICFTDSETSIKSRAVVEFVGAVVIKKKFSLVLEAVNGEMEREVWKKLSAHQKEDGEGGKTEDDNKGKSKRQRNEGECFETTQPPNKAK